MANLMLSVRGSGAFAEFERALDPRAAARGHRASPAARGLPWQEEIPVV